MTAYIDTSVLVTLYIPEKKSGVANKYLEDYIGVINSFCYLEFLSAVNKKILSKSISSATGYTVVDKLKSDIKNKSYMFISFSASDLVSAKEHFYQNLGKYSLRTVDLIHITTAINNNCDKFATSDKKQALAAKKLGLSVKLF